MHRFSSEVFRPEYFLSSRNCPKTGPQSINQSTVPQDIQLLIIDNHWLGAFHGHKVWSVTRQKVDARWKWGDISEESFFSLLYHKDKSTCGASVDWLIDWLRSKYLAIFYISFVFIRCGCCRTPLFSLYSVSSALHSSDLWNKARDAEWATGLERAPPKCVQLKVWLEAPSLNRWLTPRP